VDTGEGGVGKREREGERIFQLQQQSGEFCFEGVGKGRV